MVAISQAADIFSLANMPIDQHRANARAYAAWLIQEAQEEPDAEAAADWTAVERAIVLLTADRGTAKQ